MNRLVVAAVAIGFLILVAVGAIGVSVMQRNLDYTALVSHSYDVEQAIGAFRTLNEQVETSRRGFLLAHDPRFYSAYRQAADEIPRAIGRIRRLTLDNPVQQRNVVRLSSLSQAQLAAIDVSVQAARTAGAHATSFDFDAGVAYTRAIRAMADVMQAEEAGKLRLRNNARRQTIRTLETVSTVGAALLILLAVAVVWSLITYTRNLAASRDELHRLNASLEDEVRARTAELRRANEEIQRFAYIVSHDLRSPLVNVMGFTSELDAAIKPLAALLERAEAEAPAIVTADARTTVQSDLPEAIGFIRASSQKMDRLINAILQLSRQGRRVLTPEPVDMRQLFTTVADTLKHRSDELGAVIEVAPDTPGLVSDRLALEQIFSNLLENALKYLKPGRPGFVRVQGRRQGDRVIYEVIDNGRGIDPKDHDRVFDLFRRSGVQDQPGEGIGLAHVRALAYRLGGTVSLQSALDQGATFRVSLPAQLRLEGGQA